MEEQNIIPYVIEKLYVPNNASATRTIMNQENFKFYKLSFLKIRIIRFAFKIIFSLTHSKKQMKKVLYILKHNPWGIGGGCYASNLYFTAFL